MLGRQFILNDLNEKNEAGWLSVGEGKYHTKCKDERDYSIPDFYHQARSLGWEGARFSRLQPVSLRGQSDRTTRHPVYG
jgi:hypothetical protein